jgi:D-alanyl-D-alanine carboxypeptidase (penicillin-binding protein 5/6)
MDGAVEQPTRAVQAVDVASAITALGDAGVSGSSLANVRGGGGGRSRN